MQFLFAFLVLVALVVCSMAQYYYNGYYGTHGVAYPYAYGAYGAYNPFYYYK